jgi:hypothetical protein
MLIFRAHPETYKPIDALDDDDLDDASEEALETATKKGDEKLKDDESKGASQKDDKNDKDEKKDDKKQKQEAKDKKSEDTKPEHKKPKAAKEDAHNNGSDKKPKRGDERKNESKVARSG